ncbi:MAG: TRAP transporter substrate-binding protein [Vulcanimicrobiaceae bacterium]|jgi:tripartite ATP-independent transporter DctP family solute receptor
MTARPGPAPVSRRRFLGAAAAVAAGGAFGVPFIAPRAAGAATILKLNLPVNEADMISTCSAKFAQLVEEHSGGALHVQLFYNGVLGTQKASITDVQDGVVDMTSQSTAWLESVAPRTQALDLPFAFADAAVAERVLDGPIGRAVADDLARKGILVLAWTTHGWRDLEFVSARVTEPADVRGLKIRIQSGAVYVSIMKALGAVPTIIDFSETYLALQQRVVDGLDIPPPTVLTTKLYEVLKSVSLTHHLYNPGPLMMSKMKYDALPAPQQRAIQLAAAEVLPFWRRSFVEYQKSVLVALKAKGTTVLDVDRAAFKHQMTPVYEQIRQQAGADFVDRLLAEVT